MSTTKKKTKSTSGAAAPQLKLSEPLTQCHAILKAIMAKGTAGPFLEPVDWQTYHLYDYPQLIKNPMDLGTILTNLEAGKFSTPDQVAKDVRLVWRNAMIYNRPDSDIYVTADKLKKLFERKFLKVSKTGKRKRDGTEPQISRLDQTRFANLASALGSEDLGLLVDMLQKECPEALNEDEADDVEIEIGNIDARTLTSLIAFAEGCLNKKGKKK
jgi:hypothetical protein